ncbi:hypothetical protein L6452_14771 [Arctium lappa]|uniref:Uncharacterized protein n=1 Tax=Arctium lappa TaxID=4217 RepID=A0ACB9CLU0_ARCLA|nr:hypothetical protein L6452_14771 [Arctium lappa]
MSAPQGTRDQIMAQINLELNVARAHIDALTNQHRQAVEEIESLRNLNASNAARMSYNQAAVPSMPSVTTIPLFFHSTASIPSMPPTASIPTMPMPTFQYNGYTSDSSQRNVFQSSVPIPPATQGNTHDDPVTQRLKMLEEQNMRVLSILAKLPGVAVPVDVEPRTGFQASPCPTGYSREHA